jgi:serine/threonine-protein kinase RsbW
MNGSSTTRDFEFSSLPENLNIVESFVEQLRAELGLNDDIEANILVSLSEAVNNAIVHGNKMDPEKKVRLKMVKDEKLLTFSVEDEGSGFNPKEIMDPTAPENIDKPTGRGIFLIRSLADSVEFFDEGKKIVMTFLLN